MATSLTGGAFGFLRKSIGSITYRTSTSSIDGKLKQVASQKPTKVANPRTIAQIVQRMKIGPAHLFYTAFEKAAGSVENNPLSHSWEGIQYGPKSRMRFLQLAMQGEPKAYVPKGINFPVPGVYQVSEGKLPTLPSGVDYNGDAPYCTVASELTQANVQKLSELGAQVGDQITCLALVANNGKYEANFARVIIGIGNNWDNNTNNGKMDDLQLGENGIFFEDVAENIACAAFILSRGSSTSGAKRSTAFMTMNPNYNNLLSPEAYDAAVDSYVEGVNYNSLNSTWYLNQGSTQAFNGELFFQQLTLPAIEGVAEESIIALLGRQANGSGVRYVVFTSDGTSAGTVYARRPSGITTADSWTAARATAALGAVNVVYAKYTDAIGAQATGNA